MLGPSSKEGRMRAQRRIRRSPRRDEARVGWEKESKGRRAKGKAAMEGGGGVTLLL
jgi:hypothetical protein